MPNMFFSKLFAPWQETVADAGDGDGGGTIWDHLAPFRDDFGTILGPFWIRFRTILDSF